MPFPKNQLKLFKTKMQWTSLACMFCLYRSCDNTLGNRFFSNFVLFTCMSTHNLWKDNESRSPQTNKKKNKKQNIQAKEVHCILILKSLSWFFGKGNSLFKENFKVWKFVTYLKTGKKRSEAVNGNCKKYLVLP